MLQTAVVDTHSIGVHESWDGEGPEVTGAAQAEEGGKNGTNLAVLLQSILACP